MLLGSFLVKELLFISYFVAPPTRDCYCCAR